MPHYKKLVGAKCYLSPCSLKDAEKWTEWDNDLKVTIPLGDEAYTPYSLEKMRDIIAEVIKRQDHVFSIVDLETDDLIGRCLLFDIDPVKQASHAGTSDRGERVLGQRLWTRNNQDVA